MSRSVIAVFEFSKSSSSKNYQLSKSCFVFFFQNVLVMFDIIDRLWARTWLVFFLVLNNATLLQLIWMQRCEKEDVFFNCHNHFNWKLNPHIQISGIHLVSRLHILSFSFFQTQRGADGDRQATTRPWCLFSKPIWTFTINHADWVRSPADSVKKFRL